MAPGKQKQPQQEGHQLSVRRRQEDTQAMCSRGERATNKLGGPTQEMEGKPQGPWEPEEQPDIVEGQEGPNQELRQEWHSAEPLTDIGV